MMLPAHLVVPCNCYCFIDLLILLYGMDLPLLLTDALIATVGPPVILKIRHYSNVSLLLSKHGTDALISFRLNQHPIPIMMIFW